MKKRTIALAGTLVLSLLTSVTFAQKVDPAEKYEPSDQQSFQELFEEPTSGVLKSLRDCPIVTDAFLKNYNPFISGGSSGSGSFSGTIDVAGTGVTLFVEWFDDNTFRYEFPNGDAVMETIGVENNSDKIIYGYSSPVFLDSGLNVITGGEAEKANSLDLCVSLVDTEGPVITFISPPDEDPPAKVSGSITVLVSVRDPSGVDAETVTISVHKENGDPVVTAGMTCTLVEENVYEVYECTYLWTTAGLEGGLYTIKATANDTASTGVNFATAEVIVDFGFTLADCYGVLDDETDLNGEEPEGCNPTTQLNIQAPLDANDPDGKYIFGEVIQADPSLTTCDACGVIKSCGPDALPDPRMMWNSADNRWEPNPAWVSPTSQKAGELHVFGDGVGVRPAKLPAGAEWIIGPLHYGYEGCFGGTWHYKNWTLVEAYGDPLNPPGSMNPLFFIKTYFPELNWPYTGEIAKCYGEGADQTLKLQESAEFLYQSTKVGEMVEGMATPYTEACGSGRTLDRGKSFSGWNIIETTPDPDATPEAVVQFKCDLIDQQFANLQTVVAVAKADLTRGKVSTSERYIKQAQSQAENCPQVQSLDRAYGDLQRAFEAWQKLEFLVSERNPAGDVLGRIGNLRYRIDNVRSEILRLQ